MTDIFYTPPVSDPAMGSGEQAPFFTVSQRKLIVMLILTSGLYGLYWGYKHWAVYKVYSSRSLWPVPRAILGQIYLISLLYKVDSLLKARGKGGMPYWGFWAAAVILLSLVPATGGFLDGMIQGMSERPYAGVGKVLMIAFTTIPFVLQCLILCRAQGYINRLNEDVDGSQNKDFSRWNVAWMMVGVVYWVAGIAFLVSISEVPQ